MIMKKKLVFNVLTTPMDDADGVMKTGSRQMIINQIMADFRKFINENMPNGHGVSLINASVIECRRSEHES